MNVRTSTVRCLAGLDDRSVSDVAWQRALESGPSDVVFLTRAWQRGWWESFGRGTLIPIVVEEDGRATAIATLFADAGMGFFVGSGGSDYLDFIGRLDVPTLAVILREARRNIHDFVGFRFYHVPDHSLTGQLLPEVAEILDLVCCEEGELPAPALEIAAHPDQAQAATRKDSLLRHERRLQRGGPLAVEHLTDATAVLAQLPAFFDQHVARWAVTPYPSLFEQSGQRAFYERLAREGAAAGWLRFAIVRWNGRPVAYHFGSSYRGRYLWYKPTFDIELAKHSPGEVLLRHLLLDAIREGATLFDFGLGDEAFKQRFATRVDRVRTWGLYPPECV
jgi:CelD/BcsL family acetyltransferase involved in cellulose biosynthesis